MITSLTTIILLAFLVTNAFFILASANLTVCVVLSCIFSFLTAALYLVMNAPDVAMTEAAVGSGLSTVFMLGALSRVKNKFSMTSSGIKIEMFVLLAGFTCVIISTLIHLPMFGNQDNPSHAVLIPYYITHSLSAVGASNMVTSILASFRGYDTFGETAVVFIAGTGVFCILKCNVDEE